MVAKALRSPDLTSLVIPNQTPTLSPLPSTDSLDSLSALLTSVLALAPTMTTPEQATAQVVYIQPSHKFPPPERFSGSHDGFSCLAWLQSVRFYVEAIKAPKANWTCIAVSYLVGVATGTH